MAQGERIVNVTFCDGEKCANVQRITSKRDRKWHSTFVRHALSDGTFSVCSSLALFKKPKFELVCESPRSAFLTEFYFLANSELCVACQHPKCLCLRLTYINGLKFWTKQNKHFKQNIFIFRLCACRSANFYIL